jgi:hypothetical protein
MKNNELATRNTFLCLKDFDLSAAFSDELSGLTGSFERIKIPAAGSTVFEVPAEDPDNPEAVKEFSAVILYHHPLFAYYREKYTGGSNPPDCGSFDGITGEGYPGGSCGNCSNNKFGSGEGGGKACKNRRRMYLLREGEIFPILLSLPTGSLKDYTRYLMRLLSKGKKSNAVVTRFTLKKATNASGIVYSQAQFAVDRDLSKEEYDLINSLSEQVKSFSAKVGYDTDPAAENELGNVDSETGEIIEPLV